ncbi:hypothetical protein SDC9_111447 [bioreactor metagenome]|uniref:Uncharacterized protein n=1 Tax=bioreactor metagenome TaxID=1076179 RepID=A0A645BGI8_9ZZZZ
MLQHDKTVAVAGRFLKARIGHDYAEPAFLIGGDEDVADIAAVLTHTLHEEYPLPFLDFPESAGRHLREFATRRKALTILGRTGIGPRRKETRNSGNCENDRQGKT